MFVHINYNQIHSPHDDADNWPLVTLNCWEIETVCCQWAFPHLAHLSQLSLSFIMMCWFVVCRCFILSPRVSSRQLSSSALSNPSWQSSPSSCRPLANTTTEILSEQHLPLHLLFSTCPIQFQTCLPFTCTWKQFGSSDGLHHLSQGGMMESVWIKSCYLKL